MRQPERRTVVLEGVLTYDASSRVAEALGSLRSGDGLVIDLTRAQGLDAVMLAQLVRLLESHRAPTPVRFTGLGLRDSRILSYLGLEVDQAGWVVAPPCAQSTGGAAP